MLYKNLHYSDDNDDEEEEEEMLPTPKKKKHFKESKNFKLAFKKFMNLKIMIL